MYLIQAVKGKEFLQRADTCHKVSNAKGQFIAEILNKLNYRLVRDDHKWICQESVTQLSGEYAEFQEFKIVKGKLREITK